MNRRADEIAALAFGLALVAGFASGTAFRPASVSAASARASVAEEGGEAPTPYETLLRAAMVGDSTHFTRQDTVEEAWRVMQPLLDAPPLVHGYAPGTWGPPSAETLVAGHGRWHGPWIAT